MQVAPCSEQRSALLGPKRDSVALPVGEELDGDLSRSKEQATFCSSPALSIPFLQICLLRSFALASTGSLQTRVVGERFLPESMLRRSKGQGGGQTEKFAEKLFCFSISYRADLIVSLKSVICLSQKRVNDRLHAAATLHGAGGMSLHTAPSCAVERAAGPQKLLLVSGEGSSGGELGIGNGG